MLWSEFNDIFYKNSVRLKLFLSSSDGSKKQKAKLKTNKRKPFWFSTLPCEIAAYLAIHTFGIRMIYPGSLKIIQSFLRPVLIQGRAKLVEEDHAVRYKIQTIDNNFIDTIFVDNRTTNNSNGKTLVICSEGNSGFYEIGIMRTPMQLNYSVLGWNHPGFGGSTVSDYCTAENKDTRRINKNSCFRENHILNKIKTQSMQLYNSPFTN